MITIYYSKKVSCPISKKTLEKVARGAARLEPKIKGAVEVTIVGDKEIQKLNHRYRGINKVTDVLSFAWSEDRQIKSAVLGELFISYSQIVRQAKEFKVSAREEFIRMFVHGLLHLVGYDHVKSSEAKKMFALQEELVQKFV
ncbi:MAG: rRNA maturation RNase YbeY [Candidatus Magasanikbacteria bacterium RIFCSPHIGHO2_01_FULL_47_8]|uniref:Endoribonuclease YbeY n=1 Tax=Candidatus Magasanikbacteria bacterium RIFCSPHIGHO2_01_FULL_47_8 TaxID=1798673 RepID=A0A1F6MCG3_9BACT|nr:MAG: rRNA maturation RNase YbeY [Candidatus Magasanikbacteria bacterium RIFCSPHIGHO2_01_FULL_47_8]